MILRYYPTKDATIYEQYPHKNTGLDAILDVSKTIVGSSSYNSRVLLDFDYNTIAQNIVDLGFDPTLFNYNLKLYIADANEIPVNYSLRCYPLVYSWNMGIGRYGNYPETTDGVSWNYRNSATDLGSAWPTGGFAGDEAGTWSTVPGGGVWHNSVYATQSYTYTTSDVSLDVTSIVNEVQSGSFGFNGFLIKKTDADETSVATIFNSLKFFSKDTHTIYLPVLEARYDDSTHSAILPLIDTTQDINLISINLRSNYSEASTPVIRLSARYKYPTDTWATSSGYLDRYRLPVGTQYAVYSAHSDDVIIGFSNYTQLSDDATSNYIKLHLDSFQPERYYRLLLKVPNTNSSTYQVYDEKWIFKVTRS